MLKQIEFTSCGEREFRKLPIHLQKRVVEKVELYIKTGDPLRFAKSLVNLPPATHRFRVGKYRICFYIQGSSIVIDGVDARENAYRRK